MILLTSLISPFGRKVRMAAAVLGLDRGIELRGVDPREPDDPIRKLNPLGKMPALVLDDGAVLYDSRVILEYLDHLAGGGRIIPAEPQARFAALRLQALADGIMDAAILQVYEGRWRAPDKLEPKWLEHQAGKVDRALAALEDSPPAVAADVGAIAVACALGYLDLRFEGAWRKCHPRLEAWLAAFAAAVPACAATAPIKA
jgi:glutathione S-transferase